MDTKSLIEFFKPRTKLQKESKALILRELEKYGGDLYRRETRHAHLSASAIILNPTLDKTLMVYHNIYNSYSWTGGHADGETDLYQVAYKEAMEETGVKKLYPVSRRLLSVEALPVPEHVKKGKKIAPHNHYNVTFPFICPDNQPLSAKLDENSSVAWIKVADLDRLCAEKDMVPIYKDNIQQMLKLIGEKEKSYGLLPEKLLPWYEKSARNLPWRTNREAYHIWLSEIMLQQTKVETVIDYYNRFLTALPTIKDLAQAEEEKVMKLWEGLGYYSRARNLQKAAKVIMADYGGKFPEDMEDIARLPGIGPYTAGAIASIAFDQPTPAVDGNVLRVISRITEDYRCIDEESTKKEIARSLEAVYPQKGENDSDRSRRGDSDRSRRGNFTQSLMELGATVCLPNGAPLCGDCPTAEICLAAKNQSVSCLPVRKEKKPRNIEAITLFHLVCNGKTALTKRQEKGVLHGMWALPSVPEKLDEKRALDWLHKQDIEGNIVKKQEGKHIFTHVEWQILCYTLSCASPLGDYLWAAEDQLATEISLPTAFKKFLTKT